MSEPVVAVAGLCMVYPSQPRGAAALRDVTFDVAANEILAVVGPNAAGKTTLLDIMATTLTPSAGSLRIGSVDAIARPRDARAMLGYLPSGGRALCPRLTAAQNLRFFAALYEYCPDEGARRAEAALHICNAAEVRDTRADRLSDGMIGRVALARVLLHDPRLLLLDEPTRSIDPVQRPSLLRVIRNYVNQPGKAAVLVTHDLADVFEIADRVAVMKEGRLTHVAPVAVAGAGRSALADLTEGGPS